MSETTVCFDLRCLQIGHENRGIGMHVRSILEHLEPHSNISYVFYVFDKSNPIEKLGISVKVPYTLVTTKTLNMSISRPRDVYHLSKVVWHKFSALRKVPYTHFIQFDMMLGLPPKQPRKKNIIVAYDLIPLLFRSEYMPSPREASITKKHLPAKAKSVIRSLYYSGRYKLHYNNFSKANLVLSISENTTDSLENLLHIPRHKIITIPLAPVFNSSTPKRPHLPELDRFIFYIGATDARKRVQDLIKAFDRAHSKNGALELILAGKEFSNPKKIPNQSILDAISESPYSSSIHYLGFVTDSEKLWLYQNAEAFVFPSTYEGFGLPIIEAMQSGCVAIGYNNSSIPEVSGNAALLVETGNISQLTNAISTVISDHTYRDNLRRAGLRQSEKFSWHSYMHDFYNMLEKEL